MECWKAAKKCYCENKRKQETEKLFRCLICFPLSYICGTLPEVKMLCCIRRIHKLSLLNSQVR